MPYFLSQTGNAPKIDETVSTSNTTEQKKYIFVEQSLADYSEQEASEITKEEESKFYKKVLRTSSL